MQERLFSPLQIGAALISLGCVVVVLFTAPGTTPDSTTQYTPPPAPVQQIEVVKPEDTYLYHPKEEVIYQGGRSPSIVLKFEQ